MPAGQPGAAGTIPIRLSAVMPPTTGPPRSVIATARNGSIAVQVAAPVAPSSAYLEIRLSPSGLSDHASAPPVLVATASKSSIPANSPVTPSMRWGAGVAVT